MQIKFVKNKPLATLVVLFLLISCRSGVTIDYDLPLDEAIAIAKAAGRELVVVLSRPDCPPCAKLVQGIANGKSGAVYNIVNVQLSENQ